MPTAYPAASSIAAGGVRFARSIWINASTFGRGFSGDECAMAHAILASLVIERRNAHVLDKPSAKQGRRSYCQCADNSGQGER